ncbi:MAG: HlyC/CorC family transporter [Acidobacteria bacterium]|jgi:putative hemolysin|nr:HlyC/CorC family transporter [Acidobacteriota bacterium]
MIWIPLLVFVVFGAMAYLAVIETAFGVLMRLPERLEAERESAADGLTSYLEDPLKLFVPARFMRGLLLILSVVLLSQPIGTGFYNGLILFLTALGLTVVAGHIIPALIVRRAPERLLSMLLPPFTAMANVVTPLTSLVIGWLGEAESTTPRTNGNGSATPAHEDVTPDQEDGRLLRSVVDFGDTLVREVMTPRPDVVAVHADATVDDLRALVREQQYSRMPVYRDNLDNIVGIVVVKDLIQREGVRDDVRVSEIMRPAAFVPETKRVADLLREFQQRRFQLAMVVDEYGGIAGLVSVEDLIEELVGEIRDEYDLEAEPIVQEADGAFVFSAKVAIEEMTDRLEMTIEDEGFETVGGYVLTRAGRVPTTGERLEADGVSIEILEAERRRIHKVRVRRVPVAADGGDE